MILLGTLFWKSFFDPTNNKHTKAKNELLIYDKEKILVDQYTFFKVLVWLEENNKKEHSKWFFDYVKNTSNVRLIYLGKEELSKIKLEYIAKTDASKISRELNTLNNDQFEIAVTKYLKNSLNCDSTD